MTAATQPRTAEQLWQEYSQRGVVTAEGKPPAARFYFVIAAGVACALLVLTVVCAVMLLVTGGELGWLVGAGLALLGFLIVAAVAAALGWRVRTAQGPTWVVTPQGITIDGVGPVQWGDLEPTRRRQVRGAHLGTKEHALIMILTPAGQQRAGGLTPEQRFVLQRSARAPLSNALPVQWIRVVPMRGIRTRDWRAFLDGVHQQQVSQGPTGYSAETPPRRL